MNEPVQTDLMYLVAFDWILVGLYGVLMFGIAFWAFPKIKDCGAFLVGSRRMGKMMMVAAAFSGGTNASHPMAVAAASFQRGFSGMWLSLTWILITPFFWIFPPAIRRLRIVTNVDIVRMRFGNVMAVLYKLVAVCAVPLAIGLGIKSAAIVLYVMTGGALSMEWAIAVICVPTILYTLLGGVIAAYATDIYQGVLIVVLSIILIPFALVEIGSAAALDAAISDEFASLIQSTDVEFGFWWVFWFAIGISFAATISSSSGAAAARDEFTSRMKIFGLVIKRFCTVGWGVAGVLAAVLYVGHPLLDASSGLPGASPDNVFALASGDLLPVGLRGLMVASILAAVMSSLDASLLTISGIVVNNFYQEHFVKDASAAHYLAAARIFAVLAMAMGVWVAVGIDDIVEFATIVEPVNALTGMSILVALMWRRVTAKGAVTSVLIAAPLFIAANNPQFSLAGLNLFSVLQLEHAAVFLASLYDINLWDAAHGFVSAEGEFLRLPVQIKYPIFILPSLLSIVVVSLLTKQHNEKAVGEFYCRLDTPVGEEWRIREAGYRVDQLELLDKHEPEIVKGDVKRERLILADLFYLPGLLRSGKARLSDYRMDFYGIVLSVLFVIAFIWMIEWIGALL